MFSLLFGLTSSPSKYQVVPDLTKKYVNLNGNKSAPNVALEHNRIQDILGVRRFGTADKHIDPSVTFQLEEDLRKINQSSLPAKLKVWRSTLCRRLPLKL